MKGFKINPPFPLYPVSVFERDMGDDNALARTKRNGSIVINEDLEGPQKEITKKHEETHVQQFLDEARNPGTGLDYNAEEGWVMFKGKKYPYSKMESGDPTTAWEIPAYKNEKKYYS